MRDDACRWLLEDIGAVGMWWPFRDDIRDAVTRTRQLYQAPLLHLELWWSSVESRTAAQQGGDRFGPFYFPFLASKQTPLFTAHSKDQIVPAATPISPDWVAMCPAQQDWRTIFCESAENMVGAGPLRHHQIWVSENSTGCQADCLYYDIGPCAGVPTHCYALDHQHLPGAGRQVTEAHRSLLAESQRRASAAKGRYVPIGTECISEPFVDCLDLYYARNAGFSPDMEVANYVRRLTWLPDGRMETVPLFPFVYHQYGPVAVQGIYPVPPWTAPAGELYFAWAEARATLWGGLITTFPQMDEAVISPQRRAWLRSLAAARTDFASEYLAYGCMQRAPEIKCDMIDINHGLSDGGWLRKIRFGQDATDLQRSLAIPENTEPNQDDGDGITVEQWAKSMLALPAAPAKHPSIRVPSVLGQAFTLNASRLGVVVAHLRLDAPTDIQVVVDPTACHLPTGRYSLARITSDKRLELPGFQNRQTISLRINPGEVLLLEAVHQGQQ